MEIQINNMQLSDLEKIKDYLETEFDDFWNYQIFKQELQNSNSKYYIAQNEDGEILGFAGYLLIVDEVDITNIVVRKDLRGRGIGKRLLQHLIDSIDTSKYESITLEVSEKNKPAISLYENFDFKNLGIRKNYYENHTNAFIMTKYFNDLELSIK